MSVKPKMLTLKKHYSIMLHYKVYEHEHFDYRETSSRITTELNITYVRTRKLAP